MLVEVVRDLLHLVEVVLVAAHRSVDPDGLRERVVAGVEGARQGLAEGAHLQLRVGQRVGHEVRGLVLADRVLRVRRDLGVPGQQLRRRNGVVRYERTKDRLEKERSVHITHTLSNTHTHTQVHTIRTIVLGAEEARVRARVLEFSEGGEQARAVRLDAALARSLAVAHEAELDRVPVAGREALHVLVARAQRGQADLLREVREVLVR